MFSWLSYVVFAGMFAICPCSIPRELLAYYFWFCLRFSWIGQVSRKMVLNNNHTCCIFFANLSQHTFIFVYYEPWCSEGSKVVENSMQNMLIRCHMVENSCLIIGWRGVYFLTKFVDTWSYLILCNRVCNNLNSCGGTTMWYFHVWTIQQHSASNSQNTHNVGVRRTCGNNRWYVFTRHFSIGVWWSICFDL
jgi:hypothetical protein